MPPRRSSATVRVVAAATPMTVAAVEQLIEARVSAALANHETLRNSTNGQGDGSHNSDTGIRGTVRTLREWPSRSQSVRAEAQLFVGIVRSDDGIVHAGSGVDGLSSVRDPSGLLFVIEGLIWVSVVVHAEYAADVAVFEELWGCQCCLTDLLTKWGGGMRWRLWRGAWARIRHPKQKLGMCQKLLMRLTGWRRRWCREEEASQGEGFGDIPLS
ncbi:hypothetical protein Tco_1555453 [Tanacetum coccineum]